MKIEETFYFKGRNGHQAESHSTTDANGNIWHLNTWKTRTGVQCTAKQGQDNGNGSVSFNLSAMMGGYNDKYLNLAEEPGQCNEARVKRVHEAGIKAFLAHFEGQPDAPKPAPYVLGPGQIIYNNLGRKQTRVIFETIRPGHFKTVDFAGTNIQQNSILDIGKDFTEGNILPMDQVNELVRAATERQESARKAAEQAATLAAIERNQKIAAGIKIVPAIPETAKAVIVAKFKVDDSDHQSDYFASHTEKTVYLAWSDHTRDIFSELRKAAGKFEETKEYSTPPPMPEGENPEYWKPRDEHREKYSMGSGYYLGESKYRGWIVEKERLGQYGPTLEAIQIAAAEGLFLCNERTPQPEPTGDGRGYTHAPGFFRESGPMTRTQREQQEAREAQKTVRAQEYKPNPEQARGQAMGRTAEGNPIKLYSEHQQGTNTGRAQQGFLF